MPPARLLNSAATQERANVRLAIALGLAVVLIELGLGGGRHLAAWAVRHRAPVAPVLRPTLGSPSPTQEPTRPMALRLRDDLRREAQPFILSTRSAAERRRAVQCLANAIYYEAALEPLEGQRAVAQVVLNRVRDVGFPPSICGVVYQGWERPTGCQFSFTCNGALSRTPDLVLYAQARRVAEAALDGYVVAEVGTATHYHTADTDPWWRPALARIIGIGAHVFYSATGLSLGGAAGVQRYGGGELRLPQGVIDGRASQLRAGVAAAGGLTPRLTIIGPAAVVVRSSPDPSLEEMPAATHSVVVRLGAASGGVTNSRTPAAAIPTAPILKPPSDASGQQL